MKLKELFEVLDGQVDRLAYGGSMEVPCKPGCHDRSAECHGKCQAYKAYRAEMDAKRDARAKDSAIYISQAKMRSIRKNERQRMQGRRK